MQKIDIESQDLEELQDQVPQSISLFDYDKIFEANRLESPLSSLDGTILHQNKNLD